MIKDYNRIKIVFHGVIIYFILLVISVSSALGIIFSGPSKEVYNVASSTKNSLEIGVYQQLI